MKKSLKIIGIILALLFIGMVAIGSYVKIALPNISEAPAITIERTPERIERGKYLANHVAVCMDCHSTRDWSKFAGPLADAKLGAGGEKFDSDMGFPGTFYARNITPYALGSWTDGEVFRAVTTGVSKDGSALFPVMPYHRYGKMDKEDVYSIIAYVRSLSPVEREIPAASPDFPVNFLINTMPTEAAFISRPASSDVVNYGKYLVASAACVDCHSKTEKGSIIAGSEFGGGMEFKQPAGLVRSLNITPDMETGIGKWSKEDFVNRFKSYSDSNYIAAQLGPEDVNSPMPWSMYTGMEKSDLEAIYAYLHSLDPIKNHVVKQEKKNAK